MTNKNTQATEDTFVDEQEARAYECAFHILPTVAGTEVPALVEEIKTLITKSGGDVFDSEDPQRIELAYDIDKVVDGAHKRFHSAYFGWIRMHMTSDALLAFKEEFAHMPSILRSLVVKLTAYNIENPFRYHEVVNQEEASETPEVTTDTSEETTEDVASTDTVEEENVSETDAVVTDPEEETK